MGVTQLLQCSMLLPHHAFMTEHIEAVARKDAAHAEARGMRIQAAALARRREANAGGL